MDSRTRTFLLAAELTAREVLSLEHRPAFRASWRRLQTVVDVE